MDRFRKNCSDCFSIAAVAAVIFCLLFMKDTGTTAALRWLAVVLSVSVLMWPYMPKRSLSIPDAGFGISFALGLFLIFFMSWLISATGLVEYSDTVIFASLAVLAAAGFFISKKTENSYITWQELKSLFRGFAVFAVIFLLFFWIIGFNPIVDSGTENYMDFGFMQTIYRQKSAFPYDPWFAGEPLNYYYLGQALAVCMTRLCLTTPEYGYNFMLCTFISAIFVIVYEIVFGISNRLIPEFGSKKLLVSAGGVLGAVIAASGGNPHWLIYGVLKPFFCKMLGRDPGDSYWFPDGTVYINTQYGDPDNGKNEFPSYSVILGDLHAHVINLMFGLCVVAILFDMVFADDEDNRRSDIISLTLISVLLGYFKGANYWDFAIYFVITGAVIVFSDIARKGANLRTLGILATKAVYVFSVSFLVILPFTLHFVKMESGIELCENHSPVFKLAVLWGIPVATALYLIFLLFSKSAGEFSDKPKRFGMLAFILCVIGLVITPEFVSVVDIYGVANRRFNTMFKLTYVAYTLFAVIIGLAFTFTLYRVFQVKKRMVIYTAVAVIFAAGAVLSAGYTIHSVDQWFGDVFDHTKRVGISSLEGLRQDGVYGFEMDAYDIIAADNRKVVNIIEVAGNSYTHESALSVYTGACTPCGWFVHEWMWHNDPDPVKERADLVSFFYTSGSKEFCRSFLKTFDIDYIFVGPAEVCRYPVNRDGFYDLGDICTEKVWLDCDLALIKVDKSKL